MEVKGKSVLITGGANGIGLRLAEKLTEKGAGIGIFDVDEKAIAGLQKKHPEMYCRTCDVSNYAQVESAVDDAWNKMRGIDVLVNNAAMIRNSMLLSLSEGSIKKHDVELWDKMIATDLSSVFYMTVNIAEKMMQNRTRGVVVNVSSVCASGNAGQGAYSAAKAGVNALTVAWSKELSPLRIRVAGVAPGYTETDRTIQSLGEVVLKEWKSKIPLRRLGKPDEIADAIMFVIKNDFVNGKIIEVDGGLRI